MGEWMDDEIAAAYNEDLDGRSGDYCRHGNGIYNCETCLENTLIGDPE